MSRRCGVAKWVLMFSSVFLGAGCICAQTATVTVDTTSRNYTIAQDFAGLGFETATVTSNVDQGGVTGNFWNPDNTELTTLFQNLSVKNLRIGGSSVNGSHPTDSDIDALFQWAPLAGVHLIYSVPIYCNESATPPYCPTPASDAAIAGYISDAGYQASLQAISIGNEQDWPGFMYGHGGTDPNISNLPTYLTDWQKFATGIDQTVPEGYASPDTGSYSTSSYYTGSSCGTSYPNGVSWTQGFADCKATSGGIITSQISSVTQHLYVGGCHCWTTAGTEYYLSASQAIEDMLSGDWVDNDTGSGPQLAAGPYGLEPYTPYQWLYNNNLAPVLADKLAYRLTESDDFLGGVDGASDAFASALWTLDYMHWWAAHGAAGVNFHNNQWLYQDTIQPGNLPSPYGQEPGVKFTGGTCPSVCATASAFVSSTGSKVTSIAVNNGGVYTTAPTAVTLDAPSAPCSGTCTTATASVQTAVIPGSNPTEYEVSGVTVTNGGAGYLPAGCQSSSGVSEPCQDWVVTPKGYGIKAFDLGGHGYAETATLTDSLSPSSQASAYAVGSGLTSYVTFINKTNTVRGNSATVSLTIQPTGFSSASGAYMTLTSGTAGDPTPKAATLAGQTITNSSPWLGRWTPLSPDTSGSLTLSVPGAEAVVVRIDAAGELSGPIQINQNGALEMFAIGSSGSVEHNWQKAADIPLSPSTDWNGWTGSGFNGVTSTGGIALAKNQDNTLQAFVPTSGDVYWAQQLSPGGSWTSWTDMTSSASLGLTNLKVGNNPDGSLSVFGLNSSAVLYTISENAPEIGWASSWTALNTGSGDPAIKAGYVVARNLDGRLEVFGADSSGNVWHCWEKTTGAGWSSWQELTGAQLNPQIAVARNLGGELQVIGVDSSGNAWTNSQTSPGGSWNTTWTEITGKTLKPGIVIGQNKDGRLVLFGVSTQSPNDVWNIWQQGSAGGSFGGNWTDMGGNALDPHLVASSTQDERIQLFTVDSTGAIWSDWQAGTGGWNGWASFGGSGLAFYPGQP